MLRLESPSSASVREPEAELIKQPNIDGGNLWNACGNDWGGSKQLSCMFKGS